jgi:recombination protein RecA
MAKDKLYTDKELRSKYRGFSVNAADALADNQTALRIPSRVIWNNHQVGGGHVYGKVMELFGYESTGKTLLSLDYAYGCQQMGGVVLFADAERAFDYTWAEKNGLDSQQLEVLEYNGLEMFSDWLKDMVRYYRSILLNNEPILVIYDSIAAGETEENIGSDQSNQKGTYGMNRSKAWNEFYRKRIDFLARHGASLIMLNQVRKKIGATMYEAQEQTPGGDSHKFYASIRQSIARGSRVRGKVDKKTGLWLPNKDDGKTIGQTIYLNIPKNKTAPPQERVKSEVYFRPDRYGYVGYNRYMGLDEILVSQGVLKIKKDGNAKAYFFDGKPIVRKLDTFSDEMHNDDKLRKRLITASNILTISKAKERMASIKGNLFKVKTKKGE